MPEDDRQDLVDIDTSGPGAEVELEEERIRLRPAGGQELEGHRQ